MSLIFGSTKLSVLLLSLKSSICLSCNLFFYVISTSLAAFLLEPSTYTKSLAMMSRQQAPLAHNKDFYFFFYLLGDTIKNNPVFMQIAK